MPETEITASIKREDTSTIKITRLSINSEFSDFSPFLFRDTLFFVSGRYSSGSIVHVPSNGEGTDIYYSKKSDSATFRSVSNIGKPINTKFNEGPFALSADGNTIYFTANDKNNTLKIFESRRTGTAWSEPAVLDFCSEKFSYCHPTLSAREEFLFFSSNMPGGYGGMDLYYSKRSGGKWETPVNLGKKINSANHEVFPFIAANILYFSSNQTNGLGGLDIYAMNLQDTATGLVKHFPMPLNSSADDFGIWTDSAFEKGYFSSNRIAKNKDDIFSFYTWIPDFSESKRPIVKNSFCYSFFEESTLDASDTSSLVHEWTFGDGTRERNLKAKHCYSSPGNYLVQLNIIQKVSGEIFSSEASYTLSVEQPKQLVINCRDTLVAGKEHLISSEKSCLKDYEINNVYWSFGDGKYNHGAYVKHNYRKPGAYNLQLWVTARNQKTSQIEKFRIEKQIIVTDKSVYAKN